MKKWMIRLFIIALLGAVSTAAFAGHIYNNKMKVYEDYQKKELDLKGLGNISIDSEIPIHIGVTEGVPYAEFEQRFVDVLGHHPTYTLDVELRGDSSYITLKKEKEMDMAIFLVKENKAICNVYLPQQAIDKLDIKNTYDDIHTPGVQKLDVNLNNVDIKALNIEANEINVLLEGNYEKININSWRGEVEINSKGLAKLEMHGQIVCNLKGNFSNIDLSGSSTVWIDSSLPSDVKIQEGGNIRLRGNYHSIEAKSGSGGSVDIKSETLCKTELYHYGDIKLDGAFSEVAIEAHDSDIVINTVVVPKRINIRGFPSALTFMLPSNTPGADLIYKWDNYDQENDMTYDIISDFPIEMSERGENSRQYFFGDKSVKINIQAEPIHSIQLLDNGYISKNVIEKTNEETREESIN